MAILAAPLPMKLSACDGVGEAADPIPLLPWIKAAIMVVL